MKRILSTDPLTMTNWTWQPFLDDAIEKLNQFEIKPYPIDYKFLDKESQTGKGNRIINVKTSTWACKASKFRQVRAACVNAGKIASVLNFVINPSLHYDLPFFGGDLVTLASGHLLALDLQPAEKNDEKHTKHVWDKLIPIYKKWRKVLPDGGPIPEEAKSYFSPGFLWTRLPLVERSEQIIQEIVRPAFNEYLNLYLELTASAKPISKERSSQLLIGQKKYTAYRAEKDPARGMLTRFHGSDWTEAYIHSVLFDL